jgi:dsDNA-binding SOS-regulon protein
MKFTYETERVSTSYLFLTHDEMENKSAQLNKPLREIRDQMLSLEELLRDELEKQQGELVDRIKEELDVKMKRTKSAISEMEREHISKVNSYKNIIEEMRRQDVTLYYKKKISSI